MSSDHLRAKPRHASVAFAASFLFLTALAGQFSFERLGRENPFPIPERLVGALMAIVLAVVAGASVKTAARHSAGSWRILAILLFLAASAFWGPSSIVANEMLVDISSMAICGLSAVLLMRSAPDATQIVFLWGLFLAGAVFSAAGLLTATSGARVAAFGGGPNVYSRVTMLGLVGLAGLISVRRVPPVAALIGPVFIVATIASGSRGGMLAGIASMILLVPLLRGLRRGQVIMLIASLGVCAVVVYRRFADLIDDTVSTRVVDMTFQDRYSSGRDGLLAASIDLIKAQPFLGWGLGGFADKYGQGFTYPHNIVLQVTIEAGLVGLLFLLVCLATPARYAWLHRKQSPTIVFFSAAGLIAVASQFSGGYYDFRFFFLFAILAMPPQSPPTVMRTGRTVKHRRKTAES